MTIVAFGHIGRVGKTTCAELIAGKYGYEVLSFASPLKSMAFLTDPLVSANPVPSNVAVGRGRLQHLVKTGGWDGAKKDDTAGREVRGFLQRLGVAARDVLYPEVWIDALHRRMAEHDHVVIDDLRFPNEADWLKTLDAKLVKVHRPGFKPVNNHESETALLEYDGWDYVVNNDSSLSELPKKLDKMMTELGLV